MIVKEMVEYNLCSKMNDTIVWCRANIPDIGEVCKCRVNSNEAHNVWTISSWFTKNEYNGKGIGRCTLQRNLRFLYMHYGIPSEIKYIWNGENQYVLDWLTKHFDAVCSCSIAIQKTQADDDWSSHIYKLDVKKVLDYFGIDIRREFPTAVQSQDLLEPDLV